MHISELILELEKVKKEYGDIPVGYHDCEYIDWINILKGIRVKTLQDIGIKDRYYDGYSKHHRGYHPEKRKTVLII